VRRVLEDGATSMCLNVFSWPATARILAQLGHTGKAREDRALSKSGFYGADEVQAILD
jgi:hypothetical protein